MKIRCRDKRGRQVGVGVDKVRLLLRGKLSHCGVNSFELYHFEDGWKIIYLADTFENQHYEIPEELDQSVKNQSVVAKKLSTRSVKLVKHTY